jgi:hypothetical protein
MQMKRIILFAAILISAVVVKAQVPLSFGTIDYTQPTFRHFSQVGDSNNLHKKWFFSKYGGISTGFVAFNGGSGTFLSAPVGLRLYRQLNNNVYAFAGVSVAPTFFHSNSAAFYQPGTNKNNSFMSGTNFSTYSSAQMGLMYINDEKTFSISGSISVGRSTYSGFSSPSYAPAHYPIK